MPLGLDAWSGGGTLYSPRPAPAAKAAALILCAVPGSLAWDRLFSPVASAGVIYETQSLYHHIYVVEDDSRRLLKFDNSIQSGMYPERSLRASSHTPTSFTLRFFSGGPGGRPVHRAGSRHCA